MMEELNGDCLKRCASCNKLTYNANGLCGPCQLKQEEEEARKERIKVGVKIAMPVDPDDGQQYSTHTQFEIHQVCKEIADFLCAKNEAYGNSAIKPLRVFSKADPLEQLNVRIDDKLNRFLQGHKYPGDNDEMDLIGYLILKQVAKRMLNENNKS